VVDLNGMGAKTDGIFLTVETIPKTLTFRLTMRTRGLTRARRLPAPHSRPSPVDGARVLKFGPDFPDPLIAQAMA
jgi:hypothetical protein